MPAILLYLTRATLALILMSSGFVCNSLRLWRLWDRLELFELRHARPNGHVERALEVSIFRIDYTGGSGPEYWTLNSAGL